MNESKDDISGKAEALAKFASNTPGMKTVQDLCEAEEGATDKLLEGATDKLLWLSRTIKFVQV